MSDELSVRRAVLEAARAHRPRTVTAIPEDSEEEVELLVCGYCYDLSDVIDDSFTHDAVLAHNCPICYVWMTAEEG